MSEVTARKRGKTWSYRFEIASQGGKRKQIERGGFKRKSDALQAGAEAYAKYHHVGTIIDPKSISVEDYMKEWLELHSVNLKPTTIRNYKNLMKYRIFPTLGAKYLAAVSAADIQQLINNLFNGGYSRVTLANVKAILSSSFAYAVEPLHYLPQSPMQGVRLPSARAVPKQAAKKKQRRAITREEWERLIARFPEGSSMYLPLMIAYHCGLRSGEVFGLEWSAVDLQNKRLTVRQQLQVLNGKIYIAAPKYESVRTMTIDTVLCDALIRARIAQKQNEEEYAEFYTHYFVDDFGEVLTSGGGRPAEFVSVRANGTMVQPKNTANVCKVARERLGIKDFDFHTLRHTNTTRLIEAGVAPLLVQRRLGHRNIQTTLNIYAEVTQKMEADAAEQIENIFG